MASAARSLRLVCRSCRNQKPIPTVGPRIFVAWKSVSGVGGGFNESKVNIDDRENKPTPFDHWAELDQEEERQYRNLPPSQIVRSLIHEDTEAAAALDSLLEKESLFNEDKRIADTQKEVHESTRLLRIPRTPKPGAFWDEEEADSDLISNDDGDEFDENDMTDLAHAKLEEHREQRAYARIAIWEMPLLSKYAVPFEPPTANQPLRFRYTSYMGEFHPAEKKVVVEFSPADFGLTQIQEDKLKKLAGPRYNPEKETIKMSCESFDHQAQNKRYLAELVEKLVTEAKDPTDTFEDVPLDLRHHKFKVKSKFPKEWRLSAERVKEIAAYRAEAKRIEEAKEAEGTFVDGIQLIQKAQSRRRVGEAIPEMVSAPRPVGRRSNVRY